MQGGHFFRHEQHLLSFVKGIGNDVGNRLRLAGTRRSVKDKTPLLHGCAYGLELGRIGPDRQGDFLGRILPVEIDVSLFERLRPFQPSGHQTGYDLVPAKFVCIVVNVVPQDELAEGKISDNGLLFYIPAFLGHDGPTDRIEYLGDIHPAFIAGKRVQTTDLYPKILPQHLQQSNVQHRFFVPTADHIAFGGRLANDFYGQQQDRGKTGTRTGRGFQPLQQP